MHLKIIIKIAIAEPKTLYKRTTSDSLCPLQVTESFKRQYNGDSKRRASAYDWCLQWACALM